VIVVYHQNNRITKVVKAHNKSIIIDANASIAAILMSLAYQFPDEQIVWCNQLLENNLNIDGITTLFHHDKMMLSYDISVTGFLGNRIGFVEESPFINVNKEVTYPTWQMSSSVGVIHASVLNALQDKMRRDIDFDYFLCSVAKLCMPKGLLCYSEPRLLKQQAHTINPIKRNTFVLFRFVKQHYKTRWVFLLLLNFLLYERKFPVFPMLVSFFYKNRNANTMNLDGIVVQSSRVFITAETIDVIIPTIGRSTYLYDVLKDFAKQVKLPNQIIIVEQNSLAGSTTELDYITSEKWPFPIQHFFTHQAGACNARNVALSHIQSEWIFLADDDIRIKTDFLEKALELICNSGAEATSFSCLKKEENKLLNTIVQWGSFGSGCSIVASKLIKYIKFNIGFEFGFGEDSDFGMQLRNQGCDVLYLPEPEILHLKAPVGGFRTKPVLQWQDDEIQPKPSPTIMLYKILHTTIEQQLGYKTILFFKYYKLQKVKNPLQYYSNFQKQWKRSVFWATELNKK
jgi:glycosyltransferase involved in cell wall biosynthesis